MGRDRTMFFSTPPLIPIGVSKADGDLNGDSNELLPRMPFLSQPPPFPELRVDTEVATRTRFHRLEYERWYIQCQSTTHGHKGRF